MFPVELILRELLRHHPYMTVSQALAFAHVAHNGRATRWEIMRLSGTSQSSAYRHLDILKAGTAIVNGKEFEGAGLLAVGRDPSNRRRNIWTLTEKGEPLAATLRKIVKHGRPPRRARPRPRRRPTQSRQLAALRKALDSWHSRT